MKKILVIGGTRYIGKRIVKHHMEDGDSIEIVTRGITPDSFGGAVVRTHLDLMDPDDVNHRFPYRDYDIVYDDMVLCPDHIKERLGKLSCGKYVMISTDEVYRDYHYDIKEEEFDASAESWFYCGYHGVPYAERKRQSEAALVQDFSEIRSVRIRTPMVAGEDDYTHRLEWYVDHISDEIPMKPLNCDVQIPFSYVDDISELMYRCANADFTGAINGALDGVVSIREIIEHIEEISGKSAVFSTEGEESPIKTGKTYSLDTNMAKGLGMRFKEKGIIFDLIDEYIFRRKLS